MLHLIASGHFAATVGCMSEQLITDNSQDNSLSREAVEARFVEASHRLADHFDISLDAVQHLIGENGSFEEVLQDVRNLPLNRVIGLVEFLESYTNGVVESNATLSEQRALCFRLDAAVDKLATAFDISKDEVVQGVGRRAKHRLTYNEISIALAKDALQPLLHALVLKYEDRVEQIESSEDFMKDPANVAQMLDDMVLRDRDIAAITRRFNPPRKSRGKDRKQRPPRLSTRVTAGAILNAINAAGTASPEEGAYFLIHTSDIQGPLSTRALAYSLKSLHKRGAIVRHRLDAASHAETLAGLPKDMQTYLRATSLKGRVLLQVFPARLQFISAIEPYPTRSSATKS